MEKLQLERNELLLYVLQNPPPYVTIVLPEGVRSAAELDLTHTQSPLAVYAAATASNPIEVRVSAPPTLLGDSAEKKKKKYGLGTTGSGINSPSKGKRPRFRWKDLSNYFMSHLRGDSQMMCSPERTPPATPSRLDAAMSNPERKHSLHAYVTEPSTSEGGHVIQLSKCTSARREPLPLEGKQGYSLAEYVTPFLSQTQVSVQNPLERPVLPVIELCPVLNSAMLPEFDEDERQLLFYEHVVLAASILLPARGAWFDSKVGSRYRKAMGISNEQHARVLSNISPAIKEGQDTLNMPINLQTIERLVETSSDGDFTQRMNKILCMCSQYPEDPQQRRYPLCLRAFIYAGALSPLYGSNSSADTVLFEEEVRDVITAVRNRLEIPKSIEPFCRVHARLLSIDDDDDVERRTAFLMGVASALHELSKSTGSLSREPLTPEVKYMLYLLQETFEMSTAPISLLGVVRSDYAFLCVFDLFLESCLSLPTEFLSVYVQVNGRDLLPPMRPVKDFLLSLLLVFITCGVLRSFCNLKLEINPRNAPRDLLASVRHLGRSTREYCDLLSRSVQHAPALMLPGVTTVASHLLATHWADTLSCERLPSDFSEGLRTMLSLLLTYSSPGMENDEDVSHTILACAGNLSWVVPVMERHNCAAKGRVLARLQAAKAVAKAGVPVQRLMLNRIEELMEELESFISPPPLVPAAANVVRQRLSLVVDTLSDIFADMKAPYTRLSSRSGSLATKAGGYFEEYKAQLELQEKVFSLSLSTEDAVARLKCLSVIDERLRKIAMQSQRDYQLVRQVTGAPAAGFEDLLGTLTNPLSESINMFRDVVAATIVRVELAGLLFDKFMKTDMRLYKVLKSDKAAVPDRRHIQLEFPEVTMVSVLKRLESVIVSVSAVVNDPFVDAEVWSMTMLHFVSALYYVYFEESDCRFFRPEDWKCILQDLRIVDMFMKESFPYPPRGEPARGVTERAVELLRWLQQIVLHCFPYSSTALVNGADGAPPFAQLPPSSDTTPWSKHVVRRVLRRRKDKVAKSASGLGGFFRWDTSQ